jgi:rubrerythrin
VHKDGDRLNDDISNLIIVDCAGNMALMKKNNPKWIDKASRKHRETNRRKRAQKAAELKRKEKQRLLEIRRFKKLQEQKRKDLEERRESEQRKTELYGPMVMFWLCNGCGRTCSDVLPPIPCPKCQSLSYERVEQREKLAG